MKQIYCLSSTKLI